MEAGGSTDGNHQFVRTHKRINESGITEYAVMEFTPDQVSANSRRVEEKGEGRMEKGEGKGERQEELPF